MVRKESWRRGFAQFRGSWGSEEGELASGDLLPSGDKTEIRIRGWEAEYKLLTRFPVEHGQWVSKSKEKG